MPGIRPATPQDAEAVARLFRLVRTACLPYLPDLHTPASELAFFRDRVFPGCTVWVAGEVAIDGFCAWRPGWVDHLYIRPECQSQGLGTVLLSQAMAAYSPLRLWAFQRNAQALRFYAARGFRVIERTDGSRNEEREPDALLEWVRPWKRVARAAGFRVAGPAGVPAASRGWPRPAPPAA
jgi:GNAT superfamily N-acetyltransferase